MDLEAKASARRTPGHRASELASRPMSAGVFASNRAGAVAMRKLADVMHDSPRMAVQRMLTETLNDSPRMVAQRRLLAGAHAANTFVAQRVLDEEIPGLEEALRQRIFDFLSDRQPGSEENLRAGHAITIRNNVVSWLRERPEFKEMPLGAAVELGLTHFRETSAPAYLSALALNTAESWVMRNSGLEQGQFSIEDRALTGGNCHGLTFARDPESVFNPDMTNLLDNWEGIERAEIAVFLKGGRLAHTALSTDKGYLNTLPHGPSFYCNPDVLAPAMGYDPYFLLPRDLAAVQSLTEEAQARERESESLDQVGLVLGYGYDLGVEGARDLYFTFQELGREAQLMFARTHAETIQQIKLILETEHHVEF